MTEEEDDADADEDDAPGAAPLLLLFSPARPAPECELLGTSESITERSFWSAASRTIVAGRVLLLGRGERKKEK